MKIELIATYQQTRKVNGDQLQSRFNNTVGPWKAGRFMPLTLRPFSANNYALSKVWFKCSSINLSNQPGQVLAVPRLLRKAQ